MPKRFTPIMFRVPGRPGIFNMEELINADQPPRMVEPIYFSTSKFQGKSLGRMSMDLAVQKFDNKWCFFFTFEIWECSFLWHVEQSVIKFDNWLSPPSLIGLMWWHSNLYVLPHFVHLFPSLSKHSREMVHQNIVGLRPEDIRSLSIINPFIRSHFFLLQAGQQVVNPLDDLPGNTWLPQISHKTKNIWGWVRMQGSYCKGAVSLSNTNLCDWYGTLIPKMSLVIFILTN